VELQNTFLGRTNYEDMDRGVGFCVGLIGGGVTKKGNGGRRGGIFFSTKVILVNVCMC